MTEFRFLFAVGFAFLAGVKVDAHEYGGAAFAAIVAVISALWAVANEIRESKR